MKGKTNIPDMHLQIGPEVLDAAASEESCRIDAALDREWLAQHPDAAYRERPASVREIRALGLPQDAKVVIFRGPHGSQIRIIPEPQ